MVDYMEAIKRPFTDLKKSGLAALLGLLPVVNFLSYGYFLECAKTSINKKIGLPEWINWKDKFIKGFLFFIIWAIYSLPLFALSILMLTKITNEVFKENYMQAMGAANPVAIISMMQNLFLNQNVIGIFIVVVIVGILINYLVPMALMSYIVNNNFKEAFNFGEVFKRITKKQYLIAWLVVTAYSILIKSIGNFMPFIGGAIALALTGITSYIIFGSVYKEIKV